ncbi:transposase [Streptomyces mirabilis]|uniref:transposase n=1 Tax=Streptomyces mirabilis TaxID=68239 RepID=UPI00371436C2
MVDRHHVRAASGPAALAPHRRHGLEQRDQLSVPPPRSVESVIAGEVEVHGVQATGVPEFREGAVRIVIETGRPIPEVADELGVHSGTLHSWVSRWRRNGSASSGLPAPAAPGGRLRDTERAELERLRREIISHPQSAQDGEDAADAGKRPLASEPGTSHTVELTGS